MAHRPPQTRYAQSSGAKIAYQVSGTGPPDLAVVPGLVSHLDIDWQQIAYRRFVRALEHGGRVIRLDKRGTGLSDPVGEPPTLEQRVQDLAAVMAAARSSHAVLFGMADHHADRRGSAEPLAVRRDHVAPYRCSCLLKPLIGGMLSQRVGRGPDLPGRVFQEPGRLVQGLPNRVTRGSRVVNRPGKCPRRIARLWCDDGGQRFPDRAEVVHEPIGAGRFAGKRLLTTLGILKRLPGTIPVSGRARNQFLPVRDIAGTPVWFQ
jgi:hypothetical protein